MSVVTIVAAVDNNGYIGRNGALPWNIRSDLRRFREVTMGKPVIMGRKTFESIGRVLDGRRNIVISRNPDWIPEGHAVTVVQSLDGAIAVASSPGHRARPRGTLPEVMVIGGGEVYAQAMPVASRLLITWVRADVGGDVRFPEIDMTLWEMTSHEQPDGVLPGDDYPVSYMTFNRRT